MATTVEPLPTTIPVVSGQDYTYQHLVDVPGLSTTGGPQHVSVYTVTGSQDTPDLSSGCGTGAGAGPWRKGPRTQGSQPTVDGQLPTTSTTMEAEWNLPQDYGVSERHWRVTAPHVATGSKPRALVTRLATGPRSQTKAWLQRLYRSQGHVLRTTVPTRALGLASPHRRPPWLTADGNGLGHGPGAGDNGPGLGPGAGSGSHATGCPRHPRGTYLYALVY